MPVSNVLVVRSPFVARTVKAVRAITSEDSHIFIGMVIGISAAHCFGICRYPTAVNGRALGEERLEEISNGEPLVEDDYIALAELIDFATAERC